MANTIFGVRSDVFDEVVASPGDELSTPHAVAGNI